MSPLISPLSPSISLYLPSSSSISLYVLYPPPFLVSSVISLYLLPFPLIRPLSTRLAGTGKLCEAFEPKFAALPMKGRQWALPFEPGLKGALFWDLRLSRQQSDLAYVHTRRHRQKRSSTLKGLGEVRGDRQERV